MLNKNTAPNIAGLTGEKEQNEYKEHQKKKDGKQKF